MKKKLLLLPLLAFSSLFANDSSTPKAPESVEQQYGFVSAGLGPFPIPLPMFTGGYRVQSGHHGAEASVQVATIVEATTVKTNLLYMHYFKPNPASQFYAGAGVAPGVIFGRGYGFYEDLFFVGPQFVVGKQYRNETSDLRFFQMEVGYPTAAFCDHRTKVLNFPLVTLSYGWGF